MPAVIDPKLCGAVVPIIHDASSLPQDIRNRYLGLLHQAVDGDHDALVAAREILGRADRDAADIRACCDALDRLNSQDAPRVKSRIVKLTKQLQKTETEIGKLQSQRDELVHEIARIENVHGAILNTGPTRQRITIVSQNPAVRYALHSELAAAGL